MKMSLTVLWERNRSLINSNEREIILGDKEKVTYWN